MLTDDREGKHADGEYRIAVRVLNGRGGPRFAYVLRVLTPEPDFSLALAADRFNVTPGKSTSVSVTIERKDGLSNPIEVMAVALPEGASASPVTSRPENASASSVMLELSADGCSHPGPFRVLGKAVGGPRHRKPLAPIPGFGARTDWPWLTIRPMPESNQPMSRTTQPAKEG